MRQLQSLVLKNFLCIRERMSLAPIGVSLFYWIMGMVVVCATYTPGDSDLIQAPVFVLSFLTMIMMYLFCTNVIVKDKSSHWNQFVLTMPIRFSDILLAQYVFFLIVMAATIAFCTLTTLGIYLIVGAELDALTILMPTVLCGAFMLFSAAFEFPLLYRFGMLVTSILKSVALVALTGVFVLLYRANPDRVLGGAGALAGLPVRSHRLGDRSGDPGDAGVDGGIMALHQKAAHQNLTQTKHPQEILRVFCRSMGTEKMGDFGALRMCRRRIQGKVRLQSQTG